MASEGLEKKPGLTPAIPKEAQVMATILRDLGINDYEPGVVTQMLEFSYRYITSVLEDARTYSNHARKKQLDVDDIKLAVQMQCEQNNTAPPTREVLLELSQFRNSTQLPLVKPGAGLRLPPDRHCLTAVNYRLRSARGGTAGQSAAGGGSNSTGGGGRKVNGLSNSCSSVPAFNIQVQPSPAVKRKHDETQQ